MAYALGIDLGTTFSAAAVAGNGQAEILSLGYRSPTLPSVIVARETGEILIGEAAERRSLIEPLRTAREFKRRLGDPTPILLGSAPYGAETLMSYLLRGIFDLVVEQRGEAPSSLVISHPANWGLYKLDLLEQAVRMADVGNARYITEPVAAALHYAGRERIEPGEIVAVYDFGGGTFDAALLRRTETSFETLGDPEGIERLGGIDFDEAVFAHVMQSIADLVQDLDPSDSSAMAAVARLRDECRLAKEALSVDTDVTIPVMLPNVQTDVRLTRSEFEEMVGPRIGATIAALRRAVRSADIELSEVDRILLVGGSSRIPLVRQQVRDETDSEIFLDAHPKYAIALGAAIAAEHNLGTTIAAQMGMSAAPVTPPAPPPIAEPEESAALPAEPEPEPEPEPIPEPVEEPDPESMPESAPPAPAEESAPPSALDR
ncbi:MAG: Hsp70 family protein, partial [Thermomicrobiales bacterium]